MVLVKTEIASITSLEHSQTDNYSLKFSGSVCMHPPPPPPLQGWPRIFKGSHEMPWISADTPHPNLPPPPPHTHRKKEVQLILSNTCFSGNLLNMQSMWIGLVQFNRNKVCPQPVWEISALGNTLCGPISTVTTVLHCYAAELTILGQVVFEQISSAFSAGIFSHSVFLSLF